LACELLRERGRAEPHRVHAEVVRYFGWLAAREQARRRPGFDLKRWHTAALNLGPVGLRDLAAELAQIPVLPAPPAGEPCGGG